jgi:DNA-binding CsgD family transcriptional regulator
MNNKLLKNIVAENVISNQNKFLNTVIESFAYPFYVIDVNCYAIKMKNSAAASSPDDISKNATCYSLIHKRSNPCEGIENSCPLKKVMETKKPVVVEHIHYEGDMARNVEIHAHPIIDKKRNVIYMIECCFDITDRKNMEEELKTSEMKIKKQKSDLEQKSIALREIIEEVEVEKRLIQEKVTINVNEIILPLLEKVELYGASTEYIDLLKHCLEKLTSSFGQKITKQSLKLTPREIEICTLIERGHTNKEISRLLNISCQTVENHRKDIRKKLELTHKKVNLTSFLQNISK